MKSPDQQIYDLVFKASESLGYETYMYLPNAKAKYPFIFIGETQEIDKATKTAILGEVIQTFHVYGHKSNRKEISDMTNELINKCRTIRFTESLNVSMNTSETQKRMILDTTSDVALWHSYVSLVFNFY